MLTIHTEYLTEKQVLRAEYLAALSTYKHLKTTGGDTKTAKKKLDNAERRLNLTLYELAIEDGNGEFYPLRYIVENMDYSNTAIHWIYDKYGAHGDGTIRTKVLYGLHCIHLQSLKDAVEQGALRGPGTIGQRPKPLQDVLSKDITRQEAIEIVRSRHKTGVKPKASDVKLLELRYTATGEIRHVYREIAEIVGLSKITIQKRMKGIIKYINEVLEND